MVQILHIFEFGAMEKKPFNSISILILSIAVFLTWKWLKKHPCLLNLWTWILKLRIVRSADKTTWESRGQTRPNSTVGNWKRKKFVKWDHGARITDFSSHSDQTMMNLEAEEVYFICTLPKNYLINYTLYLGICTWFFIFSSLKFQLLWP